MATDHEPTKQQSPATLSRAAGLASVVTAGTSQVPAAKDSASSQEATSSTPQDIRVAFFFDGTGNNLDADLANNEHSNVARLFRAHHPNDERNGIFSYYLPGIGTYFKEIDDPGGTTLGLAFGARGDDRLDWAMRRLEERLEKSAGRPVLISLFGFSRGAALARAFALRISKRCERGGDGVWHLTHKKTRHRVRIYFMGLFDTVASVGSPMSNNNEPARGKALGLLSLSEAMKNRRAYGNALSLIAFGDAPGADPASGISNGHMSWADDLRIPAMVENCLHMVAAHEIRNSFPVDSLLQGQHYPRGCREMVYPGAHSDVGGGYRPGEGARSPTPGSLLSLLPLRAMRNEAIKAGVPLLKALPTETLRRDFAEDSASKADFETLSRRFTRYMQTAGWGGKPLGAMVLAHMRLYYQWRFQRIRRNLAARGEGRDTPDQAALRRFESSWAREQEQLEQSTKSLQQKYKTHQRNAQTLLNSRVPLTSNRRQKLEEELSLAKRAKDAYLSEKARLDTTPSTDGSFVRNSNIYDDQLLADARELQTLAKKKGRDKLRPHYRAILEAYEAEYNGKGLRDAEIIAFFDTYVHDSLAGFAQDATLPSDPRVIYIGGDDKLRYAANPPARRESPAFALA